MGDISNTPLTINHEANGTYKVLEELLGSTRCLRIITIGAGASGINMIRTIRKQLNNYEHVVYDKNPQVGGTVSAGADTLKQFTDKVIVV